MLIMKHSLTLDMDGDMYSTYIAHEERRRTVVLILFTNSILYCHFIAIMLFGTKYIIKEKVHSWHVIAPKVLRTQEFGILLPEGNTNISVNENRQFVINANGFLDRTGQYNKTESIYKAWNFHVISPSGW